MKPWLMILIGMALGAACFGAGVILNKAHAEQTRCWWQGALYVCERDRPQRFGQGYQMPERTECRRMGAQIVCDTRR